MREEGSDRKAVGMSVLIELFMTFAKIGLFTFGGGYAMLSIIEDICVEKKNWITHDEMMNITVIAESTPGPIMVNLATYVGSNKGGFFGAVIATTAVMLPAFLIILLIMVIAKNLLKNPYIQAILRGLKPCVIGVILATGAYMIVDNCLRKAGGGVDVVALVITGGLAVIYFGSRKIRKKGMSPIMLICVAAVVGVAVYGI